MTLTRRTHFSDIIRRSDWLFAALCIAGAGIAALFLWGGASAGQTVVFRQNGRIVRTEPLDTDAEITVSGLYTNVFEIADGTVHVVYTDCPNHQCEHTGVISSEGAAIVCAPNAVSASIEGQTKKVDVVTG